jgi:hypothetical protein
MNGFVWSAAAFAYVTLIVLVLALFAGEKSANQAGWSALILPLIGVCGMVGIAAILAVGLLVNVAGAAGMMPVLAWLIVVYPALGLLWAGFMWLFSRWQFSTFSLRELWPHFVGWPYFLWVVTGWGR